MLSRFYFLVPLFLSLGANCVCEPGTSSRRLLLAAAITCRPAEYEHLKYSAIGQREALFSNPAYVRSSVFVWSFLSGESSLGTGRERTNSIGRPLCRPRPGCGYRRCGTGDTLLVHICPLLESIQGPSDRRDVLEVSKTLPTAPPCLFGF